MPRSALFARPCRSLLPALLAALLSAGCGGTPDPAEPDDGGLPPGWLGGRVIDDTGRPLAGVSIVATPGGLTALTAGDGAFAVGPFAAGDTVTLMTDTPDSVSALDADDAWYDFVTEPLVVGDAGPVAITLLTRYDIELAGPGSWLPDNDHFSHFLEYSTSSLGSASGPSICWSWPTYPLAVHVADTLIVHADPAGDVAIDAGACMRAAMQRWNDAFGFPVLVEADAGAEAHVICVYPVLGRTKPAETAPVDPAGCGFRTCPPTRVEVRMSSVHIPDETYFTRIATHEFGHALGFWGHIDGARMLMEGGERVYSVMMTGGGTAGYPIHRFELRAIIAKHNMPQGTALEQYEGTAPWYANFPAQTAGGRGEGAGP